MRIIAKATLMQYTRDHPDAEAALLRLARWIEAARWPNPAAACAAIPGTDAVGGDRLVFNVCGNAFRLVEAVDYRRQALYVKWFGSHADYDRIDVATVEFRAPRA